MEPAQSASSKSLDLVGSTLVHVDHKELPLRLLNLTDHQARDRDCCQVLQSVTGQQNCHLQDLYERSVAGLMLDQRKQVHNLRSEYFDLFSQGPHDLGRTDLIEHWETLHQPDYIWLGESHKGDAAARCDRAIC